MCDLTELEEGWKMSADTILEGIMVFDPVLKIMQSSITGFYCIRRGIVYRRSKVVDQK